MTFNVGRTIIRFRNRAPKILIYPDKRLKRIAEPVDFNKTTLKQRTALVRKLGASLANQTYGGRLGIAAPQIGINVRVIVVRGNVIFNPTWTPTKAPPEIIMEGCYSVPKKVYNVKRAKYGWAKWTSIDGKSFEDKLTGLPAMVFQHELFHLDGMCLPEYGEEIKVEPSRVPEIKK